MTIPRFKHVQSRTSDFLLFIFEQGHVHMSARFYNMPPISSPAPFAPKFEKLESLRAVEFYLRSTVQ